MCVSDPGGIVRDAVDTMDGRDYKPATLLEGVVIRLDMMRTI